MSEAIVIAEWNGRQFYASVDEYGIARITTPVHAEHADEKDLHRFADDGGPAPE